MRIVLLVLGVVACHGPRQSVSDDSGEPSRPDTAAQTLTEDNPVPVHESAHADCDIQYDLEQPFLWEGDTVVFRAWCASGDTDVVLSVSGAPDAVFTPEGTFSWFTTGRDGGRHRLTVSAIGPSGGLPETRTVDVWLADNPDAPDATPPEPATYTEEWGLPVVHIEHDLPLDTDDVPATFTVRGDEITGEVKIRGATSVAYPKNSFTLDFDSDELTVAEWGEDARGHMVLTSTFDDNSYMRQKLTFDVWTELAVRSGQTRLAPRTFFAVVYLNREYHGLYLASDRLDDEHARQMGFGGDGDLFKAVTHDANYDRFDEHGALKDDLAMGWEKNGGADPDDLTGIRTLTEQMADMAPGRFVEIAPAVVQVESFLDWYLLVMAGFVEDSVGKNAYVYQDDHTGLWSAAPWDFNASWGQSWKTLRRDPEQLRDHTEHNRVFDLIEQTRDSREMLVARYEALHTDDGPLSSAWQLQKLEAYDAQIHAAALRDEAKWGAEYRTFFRWVEDRDEDDDWTDFEGELAYLRAWIPAREAAMAEWVAARVEDDDEEEHHD